jgi:hypothetical protein
MLYVESVTAAFWFVAEEMSAVEAKIACSHILFCIWGNEGRKEGRKRGRT